MTFGHFLLNLVSVEFELLKKIDYSQPTSMGTCGEINQQEITEQTQIQHIVVL